MRLDSRHKAGRARVREWVNAWEGGVNKLYSVWQRQRCTLKRPTDQLKVMK